MSISTRFYQFLHAWYRACAPLSCLASPRADVASGWKRWRWLVLQRRTGRLVDPTIEIRCSNDFEGRLVLERNAAIDRGTICWLGDEGDALGKITIKKNAYIGPYSFIGSCHDLSIGRDTMIGAHCYIITVNHKRDTIDKPYNQQGYEGDHVSIGDNVWIGAHVTILPGVTIGSNSIIGAGAVVNRNIPENEVWAGVPAKHIRLL